MKNDYYGKRQRLTLMLRQELAAAPRTYEHLRLKVLTEEGFTSKFVDEFLELHKGAIREKNGFFEWKA